jgi:hypothetical protein
MGIFLIESSALRFFFILLSLFKVSYFLIPRPPPPRLRPVIRRMLRVIRDVALKEAPGTPAGKKYVFSRFFVFFEKSGFSGQSGI